MAFAAEAGRHQSINQLCYSWGKRAAHNRAQILYYLAENLEVRRSEFSSQLSLLTGCSDQIARSEVTASIDRLFHWAAYSDKYGGTVQVRCTNWSNCFQMLPTDNGFLAPVAILESTDTGKVDLVHHTAVTGGTVRFDS